jgi:ABC-type phosphate/phosphonate transport system substrate-binding protein
MNLFHHSRKFLTALSLALFLLVTTACGTSTVQKPQANVPVAIQNAKYGQLERGNSASGQDFGNWVVQASKGLVKDAYVRDNSKLGVVISPTVRPNEVKDLAKSLAQGFRKNFPNQDLSVLMYAPDKQLILTALYNAKSKQIEFQQAA